jgi:hypothetical protein
MTDPATTLRDIMLELAAACPPGRFIDPNDAARAAAKRKAKPTDPPDLWRRYSKQARAEAIGLAREGKLLVLRKGKPVDPTKPIKGVIRVAMPDDSGERR